MTFCDYADCYFELLHDWVFLYYTYLTELYPGTNGKLMWVGNTAQYKNLCLKTYTTEK